MKELNLTVARNVILPSPSISIDGKYVPIKKVKNGQVDSIHYTTENDYVEITVTKHYELESKWWFVMSIFFFLISILGIFDTRVGKRFYSVQYSARVRLSDVTNLHLTFNRFKEGERAIELKGEAEVEELENVYTLNKKLNKRRKLLIFVKVLLWIAAIVGIASLVVSQL